jgi:hypothetical protein
LPTRNTVPALDENGRNSKPALSKQGGAGIWMISLTGAIRQRFAPEILLAAQIRANGDKAVGGEQKVS